MSCGIYRIRNLVTGKSYVGSSVRVEHRLARHRTELHCDIHHCDYLQRSWNKHGGEVFEFSLLFECDPDELIGLEQMVINAHAHEGLCYNTCMVAGNCLGLKQSAETIEKRAKWHRGSKRTPEQCRRIAEARRAVGITDAHKAMLASLAERRRRVLTREQCEDIIRRHRDGESWSRLSESIGLWRVGLHRELHRHFPDYRGGPSA